MVEMEFVGDDNELCDEQEQFIINVLIERGFTNKNIDIQPVGKVGDYYVANVKRIIVEKDSKTFKMIAKVAPKSDMMRAIGNTGLLYLNENIMYT